jgi:hypothetical protein
MFVITFYRAQTQLLTRMSFCRRKLGKHANKSQFLGIVICTALLSIEMDGLSGEMINRNE